jgi:predicted RNA-binding protein
MPLPVFRRTATGASDTHGRRGDTRRLRYCGPPAGCIAPEEIADGKENGIAGGFLVAPVIDAKPLGLEGRKEVSGHLFDTPDFGGREAHILTNNVEHRPSIFLYSSRVKAIMTRWLAISNRENSDVVIGKHVWGVPKRYVNAISRVRPGDTVLVYVGQKMVDKEVLPPALTGAFEVTSEMYEDTSRIFTAPAKLGDEIFPLRIKLRPVKLFDPPMEFKQLLEHLQFITNKKQWSGHIRGQAMREIPEEDYAYIMKAAETPRD